MSFTREHVLLTWGGNLPGGEHWTCSLRCAPVPLIGGAIPISDGDLDSLMGSYVPAVQAFHAHSDVGLSNKAKLTWVKTAAIDVDGKYKTGQDSVREQVFAPIDGGGASSPPPNQVAMVITLVTDQLRGHARMGRFYLPIPTIPLDQTEGIISAAAADSVRAQVKVFLEAIADVPGVDTDISPTPVVMSRIGSGVTNKIIGAKVGRALDTQRRRRRSLPENYRVVDIDTGVF